MSVEIRKLIAKGEGIDIEFKKCENKLTNDVYESVCSFLNRMRGHIFLGVDDNGEVTGVEPSAVAQIKKDFVTAINNPNKIAPVIYTSIAEYEIDGIIVLHIPIPNSSQVHRLSGRIYDRNEDADIDITDSTILVTDLYNRKNSVNTEIRVFPHISFGDIEPHRIERIESMAKSRRGSLHHPWDSLGDLDILKSANLYGKDPPTGKEGMNLAGILLLGSEQLILSVLPHHKTDAIVRIRDIDRYDDRDVISVNLVESFDRLMAFVEKHMDDPFYLEGNQRVSVRNKIFREVCSNLLIHREFTNAFPAKLIIDRKGVRTENSNRPNGFGEIDPDDFSPFPKNPIISKFFREIGLADELGSGVRNISKYMEFYSDGRPLFLEGNVFKLTLPLKARTSDQASDQAADKTIQDVLSFCRTPKSMKEIQDFAGYKLRVKTLKNTAKMLSTDLRVGVHNLNCTQNFIDARRNANEPVQQDYRPLFPPFRW